MTIARFARAGGVGVETVRFYQRRGLLAVPPRTSGPKRYGEPEVRRLHFIRSARAAGFTLTEIAELMDLDRTEDRTRAHDIANARIAALDDQITGLKASRDALRRLADRCGRGGKGPCPILEAFDDD